MPGVFSFILRAYYVREWADNFAVHGAAPVKSGYGAEGARLILHCQMYRRFVQ